MGDILKEAIADAKAVRETALENAKMALEEAFTPQIKSMLSAKLKEEELEEDEVPVTEEEDEDGDDEVAFEDEEAGDEEVPAEEGEDYGDEEVADEVPAEEGSYSEDEEAGDEEEVEEENLDLEAIIKELESELTEDDDEDDDDEEVEESAEAVSEDTVEESDEPVEESTEEVDEEIEIDENALTEEEEEEVEESNTSALESELKEYKEAVHFLKDKLHEVNILNAKLLFTNKLFKAYSLDNNQKLKVVETFDRAQTTREIKLVYSTLAEQFADNGSIVNKKSISESASTPVASTKPSTESRKVISEEVQVANRFKKLAGLIK
jgi:hypothetical protein